MGMGGSSSGNNMAPELMRGTRRFGAKAPEKRVFFCTKYTYLGHLFLKQDPVKNDFVLGILVSFLVYLSILRDLLHFFIFGCYVRLKGSIYTPQKRHF